MIRKHKGTAAVLAMIFMVTFAALGLAFYSMITTSVAVSRNDRDGMLTQGAAESGLEYAKYILSSKSFAYTTGSTVPSLSSLYNCLHSGGVSCSQVTDASGNTVVQVPASGAWVVPFGSVQAGRFRIEVRADADPSKLDLTVVGDNGTSSSSGVYTRTITTSLLPVDTTVEYSSPVDFGVASAGVFHCKKNVYVQTIDTGSTNLNDATVMSASNAVPSVTSDSNGSVDNIVGTIWVTNSTDQVASNINTTSNNAQTVVKILQHPPYFDSYTFPLSQYESDPAFAIYDTWDAFLADKSRTKTCVYIKSGSSGTSTVTIDGSNGQTINASLVFGPGVTTISINGSKQVPTLINADPTNKYAIVAPYAHITYNGNTEADITGYVVANQFSGNDNNSSKFVINNGGLITLDASTNSCDLGQSDLYIYLPKSADRPRATHSITYRRFNMSYAGYDEL